MFNSGIAYLCFNPSGNFGPSKKPFLENYCGDTAFPVKVLVDHSPVRGSYNYSDVTSFLVPVFEPQFLPRGEVRYNVGSRDSRYVLVLDPEGAFVP